MSTSLYDAHRQWALRQPDERFPSLEVLQDYTEVRKEASNETQMELKRVNLRAFHLRFFHPQSQIPDTGLQTYR